MVHRVVWSPRAAADLESIASFLAQFPRCGRVIPEFGDDALRELFAYSYRVMYQVGVNHVLIIAVIHGKQLL